MKRAQTLALAAVVAAIPGGALSQTPAFDRIIAAPNAKVLELEAGGGNITLLPDGAGGSVRLRMEQNGAPAGTPPVDASVRGDRVMVSIGRGGETLTIPFASAVPMAYTVDYPAAMQLVLRVSSGNVHIVEPSSAVEIYAGEGDVVVDSPHGSVTAEAANGNVTVTAASGSIDLAADVGDVNAQLSPSWSDGEIRMQSGRGGIHLAVTPGFRGRFDITSGTGKIHNELAASSARSPLVWLYAPAGDVFVNVLP